MSCLKDCSNLNECKCPKTECENHKRCCACIIKHKNAGNLPFCLRKAENDEKKACC